jgi:hypothetical protein
MSVGRCIPELLEQGKLTKDQADRAQELFEGHSADLTRSMSPPAAEALASQRTLEAIDFEAVEAARRKLLQAKAQDFAEDWLTRGGEHWAGGARGGGPGGPSGVLPGLGPEGPVNPHAARTLMLLLDTRRQAIEGEAFGHVAQILRQHRPIVPGKLRRPAELDELGMERFGEDSGNPVAREFANAVGETQEWLRLRANAAGANIAKLEHRGFATHHDSDAVAEAGFDAWAQVEIGRDPATGAFNRDAARWDLQRMINEETGQPFTDAELEKAARAAFASIATDGWSKREPGAFGGTSFANRLGQHRFIHYKSYADWKASQAQFGKGSAFDALLGEVKGMSRAIAAMELLGPNPEATVRFVNDRIRGEETLFLPGKLRARGLSKKLAIRFGDLWDEYTGALRQPEDRTLALAFSGYRAVAASSKLGSAPLTAVSDVGTAYATRHFNGLPEAGIIRDYAKLLADPRWRLAASYLSFVPEVWTSHVSGTHRFLTEELTGEIAQHVADGVLRASGLMAITDAGRQAHGLVTFIHATLVRDQAYEALEPAWRAALERYRIGPAEWDAIRASATEKLPNGLDLITPATMGDGEHKIRFLDMAHSERDFAVVVPDLATRASIDKNMRKGDVIGELLRSSPLMFRTFTISALLRHGGRMVDQAGAAGKLGYFLSAAIPMTLSAAIGLQVYHIARGLDPQPMDPSTPEGRGFWAQAALRGGALGMLGDIVGLSAQGGDRGLKDYVAGPLFGDVDVAQKAVRDMIAGKPRAKARLARVAEQNVPGNNIWYGRLLIDRLLTDQVQRTLDPSYDKGIAAAQKRAAQQGQQYFWAPGETAPRRAPNLMNAIEGGTHQ